MDCVDSGKPVQVLVSMGTVPHVVTKTGLAQYVRDSLQLDVTGSRLREISIDGGVKQTVVLAEHLRSTELHTVPTTPPAAASPSTPAGSTASVPSTSKTPPAPPLLALDSLKAVSDLCKTCQQQARQIGLLETQLADHARSMGEEGPRTALVAERGRNLLLSAELEDVKQRLRESEETVQQFASVIAQLKNEVRLLVEVHSVGDFSGSV